MKPPHHNRKLHFQTLEERCVLDGDPALLSNGDEVRREVGQEDPFDEFFFDSPAGESVWLSVGEERAKTGNTVRLEVQTPSGSVITASDPNSAFTFFQTTEAGRYRVFVSEVGNEQDFDYKLRFITTASLPARRGALDGFISPGERRGGTLEFGQLSLVQFDAAADTSIFASLGEVGGGGSPRLWLFTPEGELLVNTSDNTGIATSFTATRTGTYSAVIGEVNGDSFLPFTFSVAAFPGQIDYDLQGNTFLESGQRHTDTLQIGEQHFIQFEAQAGNRVYAALGDSVGPGTAAVRIIDPAGRVVSGTSLADNEGLNLSFDVLTSGLYTAVVLEDRSDSQLSYTFSLATLPGAVDYSLPQNALLGSGERHTGSLAIGEQDLIQFEVSAGNRVFATLGDTAGPGTVAIRVIDPSGRVVSGTSLADNEGVEFSFDALASGLYTAVILEDRSDSQLSYTFSLAALPGAVDYSLSQNTFVQSGERHTGSLAIGEQDLIQFELAAGDRVFAAFGDTEGPGTPAIRIVDPNGRVVSGTSLADNEGVEIGFFALSSGLYTAVITESRGDSPLNYRFRHAVVKRESPDSNLFDETLMNGVSVSDSFGFGAFSIHPFFVGESDSFQLVLSEQGTTGGTPRLQIFDPSARRLVNFADNSVVSASLTALQTGQYFAVVSEDRGDDLLGYTLTATGVSSPFPTVPGDFDGDLRVDVGDYLSWSEHFGQSSGEALFADFNRDGTVDLADYTVWRDNLGTVVTVQQSLAPGPASLKSETGQQAPPIAIALPVRSVDSLAVSSDDSGPPLPNRTADSALLLLFDKKVALDESLEVSRSLIEPVMEDARDAEIDAIFADLEIDELGWA